LSAQDGLFDDKHIYLQWLKRRSAQPIRITRFFKRILWTASVIFLLLCITETLFYSAEWLSIAVVALLVILPLISIFSYFLWYTPMAIHEDSRSSTLEFIFMSVIPTGEMVSDLRRFIASQNLQILMPSIVAFGGAFLIEILRSGFPIFTGFTEKFMFVSIIFIVVLIWWMILETGIIAAGLPRIVSTTGMAFLLYIIPVLAAIFVGGYYVSEFFTDIALRWVMGTLAPVAGNYGGYYGGSYGGYSPYDIEPVAMCSTYMTLATIFALAPFLLSKRVMEQRRSGRWN